MMLLEEGGKGGFICLMAAFLVKRMILVWSQLQIYKISAMQDNFFHGMTTFDSYCCSTKYKNDIDKFTRLSVRVLASQPSSRPFGQPIDAMEAV